MLALRQIIIKFYRHRIITFTSLPRRITLDRDPRSVGAPQGSDFPSALLRFGACLGIEMHVCPPRHPQKNAFVERCCAVFPLWQEGEYLTSKANKQRRR